MQYVVVDLYQKIPKRRFIFLNTIMLGDGQRGENLGKNLILKLNSGNLLKNQKDGYL